MTQGETVIQRTPILVVALLVACAPDRDASPEGWQLHERRDPLTGEVWRALEGRGTLDMENSALWARRLTGYPSSAALGLICARTDTSKADWLSSLPPTLVLYIRDSVAVANSTVAQVIAEADRAKGWQIRYRVHGQPPSDWATLWLGPPGELQPDRKTFMIFGAYAGGPLSQAMTTGDSVRLRLRPLQIEGTYLDFVFSLSGFASAYSRCIGS